MALCDALKVPGSVREKAWKTYEGLAAAEGAPVSPWGQAAPLHTDPESRQESPTRGQPLCGIFRASQRQFWTGCPHLFPCVLCPLCPSSGGAERDCRKTRGLLSNSYFFPFPACNRYVLVALVFLFNTSHWLCK